MNIAQQIQILERLISAYDHLVEYAESSTLDEDVSPHLMFTKERAAADALLTILIAQRDAPEEFQWTRVKSDINGNPRHRCKLDLFSTHDELTAMAHSVSKKVFEDALNAASERARSLGGRVTKTGVIVSTYNRPNFARRVGQIVNRKYTSVE